jgi:hypothetical protein
VLAAEHLLDLAGLDLLSQHFESLAELGVDHLSGVGPFKQHGKVVALLPERHDQIAILLQPAASLLDLLGFGLILPEIGRGGTRLEAGQLVFGFGGFKENSADRRRACPDRRNGAGVRRQSASGTLTEWQLVQSRALH